MTGKDLWMRISKHKQKLWIVGLAAGVLLLILPSVSDTAGNEVIPENDADLKQETQEYKDQLTKELTELLSEIEGVGSVKLLLTFENSVEYEYLKEESENTDTGADDRRRDYSESYLFVEDAAGNKKVLAVKRNLPQVCGAAVVCEGGDDALVRQRITELLRAALDISSANISVSPLA